MKTKLNHPKQRKVFIWTKINNDNNIEKFSTGKLGKEREKKWARWYKDQNHTILTTVELPFKSGILAKLFFSVRFFTLLSLHTVAVLEFVKIFVEHDNRKTTENKGKKTDTDEMDRLLPREIRSW